MESDMVDSRGYVEASASGVVGDTLGNGKQLDMLLKYDMKSIWPLKTAAENTRKRGKL
jgi:hypothetical protein